MTAKGFLTADRARGLAVAFLVNAALLALLAIGPQAKLQLRPETPSRVIVLNVFRSPPRKVVESERLSDGKPPPQTLRPPSPRPPAPPEATPVAAPPVAPGLAAPSPTAPAVAATPGVASDKGAAAVRHLLGCAAFAAGRRRDGDDCETQRSGEPGHIDALTPEKRLGLGLPSPERREDLEATSRELHRSTFVPQGSYARYGCNLKDGKWKCSTY